jgi:hypothetical protein
MRKRRSSMRRPVVIGHCHVGQADERTGMGSLLDPCDGSDLRKWTNRLKDR